MDKLTPEQRSTCMSRIRSKDTKPEMIVRRLLHSRGYRYRLHDRRLPGKPDLTFVRWRKVIFVHGCFWHMHEGCKRAGIPKSRIGFWKLKLEKNRARDQLNTARLTAMGWRVLVVWECELLDVEAVAEKLEYFLNS